MPGSVFLSTVDSDAFYRHAMILVLKIAVSVNVIPFFALILNLHISKLRIDGYIRNDDRKKMYGGRV